VAEIEFPHQLLCIVDIVVDIAAFRLRRHDVADAYISELGPVRCRERSHEVALRYDAHDPVAHLANGYRADGVGVHGFGDGFQRVILPAGYEALAQVLEKLADFHGVIPLVGLTFTALTTASLGLRNPLHQRVRGNEK
jgi:hypothetical protein